MFAIHPLANGAVRLSDVTSAVASHHVGVVSAGPAAVDFFKMVHCATAGLTRQYQCECGSFVSIATSIAHGNTAGGICTLSTGMKGTELWRHHYRHEKRKTKETNLLLKSDFSDHSRNCSFWFFGAWHVLPVSVRVLSGYSDFLPHHSPKTYS